MEEPTKQNDSIERSRLRQKDQVWLDEGISSVDWEGFSHLNGKLLQWHRSDPLNR